MRRFSPKMPAYLQKLAAQTSGIELAKEESLHVQVGNWIATLPEDERDGPHPVNVLHQHFDAAPRRLQNAMMRLGYTLKRLRYDGETIAYWLR
ncbi:hypothetical protein [Paraburkholderia domus]|uniref:hypothetical protein n=1 Tax=Paraburkholderia domus TaxID=2793075 RepID=UPI001B134032|nr:hypothetical protein [Paraburkholderia domus]CAE6747719.1 hypothetical protein R75483_02975 [Paraburkholderia domus]